MSTVIVKPLIHEIYEYDVTSDGQILSKYTKTPLQKKVNNNYNVVCFRQQNKSELFRVDKIVAETFHGKEPEDSFVLHIDKNTLNDSADNLQWMSYIDYLEEKYNCKWKKVENYDIYYVSDQGQLWSSKLGDFLSTRIISGCSSVQLKSKFFHVHRIVGLHFCEKPITDEKLYVQHINQDVNDNRAENLKLVPKSQHNKQKRTPLVSAVEKNESKVNTREKNTDIVILQEIPSLPNYFATSDGQIWSDKSQKFLKQHVNSNGYMRLACDKKSYYVHRLIAEAFLGSPPDEKSQINHKNEDRTDNRVDNLEWCSQSYNLKQRLIKHPDMYKDKMKSVVQMDEHGNTIKIFAGVSLASRETNINCGSITKACKNGTFAGNYKWKYNN